MLDSLLIHSSGADKIMLTIPRKKGESVIIGDNIQVTVVEVQGDEVQLSVEYPPEAWDGKQEIDETIEREAMLVPQPG